jgi:ankyrin repeat protein
MDIGSLLAQADKELGDAPLYDNDLFEKDEDHDHRQEESKQPEKKSAMDVLKAAAQRVEKEEKYEAEQVFKEAAKEVKQISDHIKEEEWKKDEDADALKILIDASKEVEDLHKDTNVEIVSPHKPKIEEEVDEGIETDEDEEEFDEKLSKHLIYACHQGNLSKVEKILDREGINLMHRDRHGWTCLHWAASKGYVDIIEALVRHRRRQNKKVKKFLNAQDKLAGWTALHVRLIIQEKSIF